MMPIIRETGLKDHISRPMCNLTVLKYSAEPVHDGFTHTNILCNLITGLEGIPRGGISLSHKDVWMIFANLEDIDNYPIRPQQREAWRCLQEVYLRPPCHLCKVSCDVVRPEV